MLEITVSLVKSLIINEFPEFKDLPIIPVKVGGWDNRTYHLGDTMVIRVPSGKCYAGSIVTEYKWLPILSQYISLQIPMPVAIGKPSVVFPYYWSIYKWIDGVSGNCLTMNDSELSCIALPLAQFLRELSNISSLDGPLFGIHNFYRGGPLGIYDSQVQSSLLQLQNIIDTKAVNAIWRRALQSEWHQDLVWVHGDLSAGNILIKENQLVGVIDFGQMAIGDPACDLVIAWTLLRNESRDLFKSNLSYDDKTWQRARGWALWKALITLCSLLNDHDNQKSQEIENQQRIIQDVINDSAMSM